MALKKLNPELVKYIVVHCSATPAKMDIGVNEIDRWHRDRGFLKIGYHIVIRRDGTMEMGRPLDEVGAHAEGHNSVSVAVCLVGGVDASKLMKPENNFTPDQMVTLEMTILGLSTRFSHAEIIGHRDLPGVAKACPSFDVKAWAKETFV
jgi:N-acetylmuramoyl-L-alanine amidase